jgi:hypothetical protein
MSSTSSTTLPLNNGVSSSSNEETSGNAAMVQTVVDCWPNCHPDQVIGELKKITVENFGQNKKEFWKSYSSYASMTPLQQNNTVAYFLKLSIEKQSAILIIAQHESSKDTKIEQKRREAVQKDDLVRLLEMRKCPEAMMLWSQTEATLTRSALDARRSTDAPDITGRGSLADESDPYGGLAVIYNDYEGFRPQNKLIQHRLDEHGKSVPIVPFRPESVEVTALAALCHDLNPTNMSRQSTYRDGPWIKEHWIMLKSWMTLVLTDFNR